jgi:HlyD family secretion protein
MKHVTLLFLGAVVCLAAGMLIQWRLHGSLAETSAKLSGQERAAAADTGLYTVAALGRLEPEGEVIDIGAGSGTLDRLERLLVAEGSRVDAGQELAYLESYGPRVAERDYVAAQLAEAKARFASESAYWEAQIQEVRIAVDSLERLQPLDLEAQKSTLRLREAEFAHAGRELKRFTDLKQSDASTQQELDHQTLLLDRSREGLDAARLQLQRLKTSQQLDLSRAKAQLVAAQAALNRARDIQPVESLTKNLQLAEERLKLSIIRSPCAGEILKVRTHPGEAVGAKPILRMGRTDAMMAVAEVYYTDIHRAKTGQKALVTSPALPNPLTGTVIQVGSLIAKNDVLGIDPTADVDARVVEVRIRLDPNSTASHLVHLQVNVQIQGKAGTTR